MMYPYWELPPEQGQIDPALLLKHGCFITLILFIANVLAGYLLEKLS